MTSLPLRAPQTGALIEYLHVVTTVPVGYGEAPDGGGWRNPDGSPGAPGASSFQGYGVVHPIDGGQIDGNLARPSVDGDLVWQINAIGGTQAHADTIADQFTTALLGPLPVGLLVVPGRALLWVRVHVPHGAARQDADQPSTWWSPGRYRIGTTPLT